MRKFTDTTMVAMDKDEIKELYTLIEDFDLVDYIKDIVFDGDNYSKAHRRMMKVLDEVWA